ncbi:MAG: hypothetical protein MUC36_26175 [Planctomycetes bacterium]|jgi:hypothetical protein|nr:hypothetical protein [Planctomycetota bacterium]
MNKGLLLILLPLASVATAQTAALTALSPATLRASAGGQSTFSTIPTGALPDLGSEAAFLLGATVTQMRVDWQLFVQPTGIDLQLTRIANAPAGATASLTGGDLLLVLSNPSAQACRLELALPAVPSSPGLVQSLAIDVGNDGSFEFQTGSPVTGASLLVNLGPVPLAVRIQTQANLTGPASLNSVLSLSLRPVGRAVLTPAAGGCSDGFQHLVRTRFDGGLELRVAGPLQFGRPALLVLGANVQPFTFPSTQPLPCLLVPAPDVVLLANQPFVQPIPAAVPPGTTFWSQAVTVDLLDPRLVETTNAFQVTIF